MTKLTNLMKSVWLELKSEKIYVFLGALLLTTMLASAVFIAFISNNIMSVLYLMRIVYALIEFLFKLKDLIMTA